MVRARVEHECSECHHTIGKGETYRRVDTRKVCARCETASAWLAEIRKALEGKTP